MFDFLAYSSTKLQLFLLLIVRASGLFLAAPILQHRSFPTTAKVGLIFLLALVSMPALQDVSIPETLTLLELAGLAVKELMVGVLTGFFFFLLFKAAELAGVITGFQVGLAISQSFDPNAGEQVSIIGRLWVALASLIFLAINGHHLVIQAFADSCRVITPGQMVVSGDTALVMIKYTAYVFVLAIKIAAPVMITLTLTDVALGTIAKLMPTMNIFIVGFPLKIGVGLMVVALSLPVFAYVLEKSTLYLNSGMSELLASMAQR